MLKFKARVLKQVEEQLTKLEEEIKARLEEENRELGENDGKYGFTLSHSSFRFFWLRISPHGCYRNNQN